MRSPYAANLLLRQSHRNNAMEIKEAITTLEANPPFIEWRSGNPHHYFSYAMKISDLNADEGWQIGF